MGPRALDPTSPSNVTLQRHPPTSPSNVTLQRHPPTSPSNVTLQRHPPTSPSNVTLQRHPPTSPSNVTLQRHPPTSPSNVTLQRHPPTSPSNVTLQRHPPTSPSNVTLQRHPSSWIHLFCCEMEDFLAVTEVITATHGDRAIRLPDAGPLIVGHALPSHGPTLIARAHIHVCPCTATTRAVLACTTDAILPISLGFYPSPFFISPARRLRVTPPNTLNTIASRGVLLRLTTAPIDLREGMPAGAPLSPQRSLWRPVATRWHSRCSRAIPARCGLRPSALVAPLETIGVRAGIEPAIAAG